MEQDTLQKKKMPSTFFLDCNKYSLFSGNSQTTSVQWIRVLVEPSLTAWFMRQSMWTSNVIFCTKSILVLKIAAAVWTVEFCRSSVSPQQQEEPGVRIPAPRTISTRTEVTCLQEIFMHLILKKILVFLPAVLKSKYCEHIVSNTRGFRCFLLQL